MDLDTILDAVPGSPKVKASIAAGAVALYFLALFARGFFRADSKPGKVCDFIVNGLRPRPTRLVETPPTKSVPPALLVLLLGGLLFAAPARAAEPGGLLPFAGVCNIPGTVCVQPAVTVVPTLIDFRSFNISRNVGFAAGYAVVFPKRLFGKLDLGIDFLGGVQTGGGWIAAALPRFGALRLGPVVSHKPGVTYAGLGIGAGL